MTRTTWAAALAILTGCVRVVPSAPEANAPPIPLIYSVPAPATATYAFRDSTLIAVEGGALGNIQINSSASATADITYAQDGSNIEATIRVTDFNGVSTNSATGSSTTATESDIVGPAVLSLTPRGRATIGTLPELSPAVQRVINASYFRRFFVQLPGASVRPGSVWVDTVRTTDDAAGTVVSVDDVVTSTFARDSVLAGRTLAVISISAQRAVTITGSTEGAELVQKLTGPGSGWALWDIERGLLIERSETWQLSGTFDLPQMGVSGLPITARSGGRLELK